MVAEWYELRGYFVRRNVLVGKRPKGGYECELDVVAFHPEKKHLVHVEPSMDSHTWQVREQRFAKKFAAGKAYIPKLFSGLDVPTDIEQIALLGYAGPKSPTTLAGGKVLLVPTLLKEIVAELSTKKIASGAVPEQFVILRTIQFVAQYRKSIFVGVATAIQ
jgi:hypothetical protein